MLFGALSPALASALFAQRADILARVLGLPVPAATDAQTLIRHQQHAQIAPGNDGTTQQDDSTRHAEHGLFCVFCLAPSAVAALPAAAPLCLLISRSRGEIALPPRVIAPALAPFSTQRSRAPPSPV
jgi:hypothetical protein